MKMLQKYVVINSFKSKKLTVDKVEIEHVNDYFNIIQHVIKLGENTPEYVSSQLADLFYLFVIFLIKDTADTKKYTIKNIITGTPITEIAHNIEV